MACIFSGTCSEKMVTGHPLIKCPCHFQAAESVAPLLRRGGLPRSPLNGRDALSPDALRALEHVQQPRAQCQPPPDVPAAWTKGGGAPNQGGGTAAGRQQRRRVRRLRLRGRGG